ncbi:Organic cation transporter 1 [Sarcoptes scabiei]|uniref:Organic cation transporter 1 n=1 Tax=Sarcoptes scabiei TaxID=52283 RepID=A0A834VGK9_SARSC|nr:Organic cation transporter 1 [Sarcoptes scabiei]
MNSNLIEQHQNDSLASLPRIKCSKGYDHDRTVFTETASTWFELYCERDYLKNMILFATQSVCSGRRKAFLITLFVAQLSCFVPIVSKNFHLFIVTRILAGGVLNVYYQLPFVIVQELVSPKFRTIASFLSAIFFSLGSCSLTFVLRLANDWVTLTWIILLFNLSFIVAFKMIPESPSWLISKHRYDEAFEQMARICRCNKRPIPNDLMTKIMEAKKILGTDELIEMKICKAVSDDDSMNSMHCSRNDRTNCTETNTDLKSNTDGVSGNDDTFWDLVVHPHLRWKTFIITVVYSACIIGYGGLVVNTINLDAETQLFSFLLLSFVEIPSLFVGWRLIVSPLGRRWTTVFSLGICGLTLITPALFNPNGTREFFQIFSLIGKFFISITFMVIYQFASEIFPTTLRNQGIGLTTSIAAIGSVLPPYIAYLDKYGSWIPMLIIGLICLFSSIIASFAPETLHKRLPQTILESQRIFSRQNYFSLAKSSTQKQSIEKK